MLRLKRRNPPSGIDTGQILLVVGVWYAYKAGILTKLLHDLGLQTGTGGTGGGPSFSGAISTAAGLTYIVEYKDNLTDENWSPLTLIEGDGTVKPFTDAGPLPPNRFYRTRIYVP